ncbi:MAG: hypothetical protein ACM30I_03815 [Gemmatimonas sp.]
MRRDIAITASSWSGLFAGSAAWFTAQQAGAWKVFAECADHRLWVIAINVIALAVALAGAALSWRVRRVPDVTGLSAERLNFTGVLCAGIAVVFAMAIVLQGMAGMILSGCER